ncbi:DUF2752 domain-containing protein [Flavobacterium psychrotrophum]|uniref:DUF2752 domain-containing protein n=1 Tax=Flavobacterium psychrotrophum TaxID=2294119 RepID=UPI000E30E308|nr:DUF2752 domain-containing protein [Flavobacterium psychrotrophum]
MIQNTIYAKAFKTVWIIYSALALLTLLVSVCVSKELILQASPTCYSIRQFGKPCFMCGATRSFIQMGKGNLNEALNYNRLAVVLFIIFIVNSIIFTYYTTTYITTIFFKQKITT